MKVFTFQMSGKIMDSANVAFEAVILTHPHLLFAIFGRASGQIFEKMRVLAHRALNLVQKAKLSSRDQVGC